MFSFVLSGYPHLHAESASTLPLVKEELTKIESDRAGKIAEIGKPLKSLEEKYIQALQVEKTNAQAAGNLKAFQEIEKEITRIKTSAGDFGGVTQHEKLARLRGIYLKNREKLDNAAGPLVLAVDEESAAKLKDLVTALTQTGEIQEAKKVQESLDELEISIGNRRNKPSSNEPPSEEDEHGMIFIEGDRARGILGFRMGRHEVTWGEWRKVRSWATPKGYELRNIGDGITGNHPVTDVSWHDVVKWCNARSEMYGLKPVYLLNGAVMKSGIRSPDLDIKANGFRMPDKREWQFAASGALKGRNDYPYSGGNDINDVAWYEGNSNNKAHRVGSKASNELGIYDMSGNVWEWCWDLRKTRDRSVLGGGYNSTKDLCIVSRTFSYDPNHRARHTGFRLARNSED